MSADNAANKYKALYRLLERRLIDGGVISADESKKIRRYQSRKRYLHARHIIDLCNYALHKLREDQHELRVFCNTGLHAVKEIAKELDKS